MPVLPRPERLLGLLCVLGCLVAPPLAAADKTLVESAAVRTTPAGAVLDARIDIALTPPIADALSRGIVQPFVVEFELERKRNWWFDSTALDTSFRTRLGYHLLLRRYIVETAQATHTYDTLDAALAALGTLDGQRLPDDVKIEPGATYHARLRFRIDTEALPKPIIIGTFTSDRWALATPWHDWSFEGAAASE